MTEALRIGWSWLGRLEYGPALLLQERLRDRVRGDERCGCLLLLEHPPVITFGYSLRGDEGRSELKSDRPTLARAGITLHQADRGGKATYHGPGQLVGYPVLDLRRLHLGTKRYVGKLEEFLLALLKELGVEAQSDPRFPGVWVKEAKIAALGVHVEDRVTTHGFALNLDPDLDHFRHIVPCGLPDREITSVAKLRGQAPGLEEVIPAAVSGFARTFQAEMQELPRPELLALIREESA
jgi:lipoate-protein ligase B